MSLILLQIGEIWRTDTPGHVVALVHHSRSTALSGQDPRVSYNTTAAQRELGRNRCLNGVQTMDKQARAA